MYHRSLSEITRDATILPCGKPSSNEVRRERLRQLATILDKHSGPIRLLSRIEFLPRPDFSAARCDGSPLTVAFENSELRRQGLESDRLGDAMTFFGLTRDKAHHLFCDCHYAGSPDSRSVARRVRGLAERRSILELAKAIWFRLFATYTQDSLIKEK
jgi:hypothetical protein